ncbi:MAG: DHH family phosphoesterase [Candidatus Methanoperedens sp.]|nr:DHH family phosphoesterase [Candidatus Methanoperedens sp.]MCE8428473.1 DHH family phosphoesterase [Candidatus Methanoperedens sp.]
MTDGNDNLIELEALSKKVADVILQQDVVRLISHNDADGLSAAGIICNALYRKGIRFHATIVKQFDNETVELIEKTTQGAVILCDMGSGQVELSSKLKNAIIIDHHKPAGQLSHVHFNPHLVGIDGSSELCASSGAYMVARQMGDNTDLAGLALAGATGDKQAMKGANKFILDEAIHNKVITVEKGLKMGDDPIEDLFECNIDPFLDMTGDRDKIKAFLDGSGFKGRIKDLNERDMKRFTSLLILKLAGQGSLSAIDSLIGDIYVLNYEAVPNIIDLVNILNACGNADRPGLGLAVCMRDASAVNEAMQITRENQKNIIASIKKAQSQIRSAKSFRYVMLDDVSGTGVIAGTIIRYLYSDKPFITFNEVNDRIKISARGTRKLVSGGLDLASAMREASSSVGGLGGGHDVASGATIPRETAQKFIEIVDSIISSQLKRNES